MSNTDITVNKNSTAIVPKGLVEAKLKVNKHQMDIIAILLAQIGKKTDIDENLTYTITTEDLASLLDSADNKWIAEILREYICEGNKAENSIRLIGFDMFTDDGSFEHYNWFSSVKYKDGVATLEVTPEIKAYLVNFKKKNQYRVFAQLRYVLPMKSVYSKRIYLMCKEFKASGYRFCDNDWMVFLSKLGVPQSYSLTNIQTQILDRAREEINTLSDITIDYSITFEKGRGGKRPTGIKFSIHSKDVEEETVEDVIDMKPQISKEDINNMSAEEMKALLLSMAK